MVMLPGVRHASYAMAAEDVRIAPAGLPGRLEVPAGAGAIVVFAHGSGSSRLSPRNTHVAAALRSLGLGTLLFDLLTGVESEDRRNVFDIEVLALNRAAHDALTGEERLVVVPGATHLFEEAGALEQVTTLAGQWFLDHLVPQDDA